MPDACNSRAIVKENAQQIGALSTPEAVELRRQHARLQEQERQIKCDYLLYQCDYLLYHQLA